jgi:uncharacterized lipoprotein YajG
VERIVQWIPRAAGLLTVGLFSGCAWTTDQVALGYTAQPNVHKMGEADKVFVTVTVNDERSDNKVVGFKSNAFGMEAGAIVTAGDVANLVQNAIETELADRGFKLTLTNGVNIVAHLSTFRNHFEPSGWSCDAVAEVILNITVKNQAGTLVYSRRIQGQGNNPNIQFATGSNAKEALDAAFKDCMKKMFDDQAFIDALLQSNQSTSQSRKSIKSNTGKDKTDYEND